MEMKKSNKDYLLPDTYSDMYGYVSNKASISPHILDEMKKLMMPPSNRIDEYGNEVLVTEQDLKDDLEKLQKSVEEARRKSEKIQDALSFIQSLPFRVGDAAFHRSFGNVLVNGVVLNSGEGYQNSSYSITMMSGKRGQVPLDELVPISEATKILYGKG